MKKLHIIILLLAGIASHNGSAAQTRVNLDHDGASRAYQLYIPSSYKISEPAPLVIALHGRSTNLVYHISPDKFVWNEFEQLRWPEGRRAGCP